MGGEKKNARQGGKKEKEREQKRTHVLASSSWIRALGRGRRISTCPRAWGLGLQVCRGLFLVSHEGGTCHIGTVGQSQSSCEGGGIGCVRAADVMGGVVWDQDAMRNFARWGGMTTCRKSRKIERRKRETRVAKKKRKQLHSLTSNQHHCS